MASGGPTSAEESGGEGVGEAPVGGGVSDGADPPPCQYSAAVATSTASMPDDAETTISRTQAYSNGIQVNYTKKVRKKWVVLQKETIIPTWMNRTFVDDFQSRATSFLDEALDEEDARYDERNWDGGNTGRGGQEEEEEEEEEWKGAFPPLEPFEIKKQPPRAHTPDCPGMCGGKCQRKTKEKPKAEPKPGSKATKGVRAPAAASGTRLPPGGQSRPTSRGGPTPTITPTPSASTTASGAICTGPRPPCGRGARLPPAERQRPASSGGARRPPTTRPPRPAPRPASGPPPARPTGSAASTSRTKLGPKASSLSKKGKPKKNVCFASPVGVVEHIQTTYRHYFLNNKGQLEYLTLYHPDYSHPDRAAIRRKIERIKQGHGECLTCQSYLPLPEGWEEMDSAARLQHVEASEFTDPGRHPIQRAPFNLLPVTEPDLRGHLGVRQDAPWPYTPDYAWPPIGPLAPPPVPRGMPALPAPPGSTPSSPEDPELARMHAMVSQSPAFLQALVGAPAQYIQQMPQGQGGNVRFTPAQPPCRYRKSPPSQQMGSPPQALPSSSPTTRTSPPRAIQPMAVALPTSPQPGPSWASQPWVSPEAAPPIPASEFSPPPIMYETPQFLAQLQQCVAQRAGLGAPPGQPPPPPVIMAPAPPGSPQRTSPRPPQCSPTAMYGSPAISPQMRGTPPSSPQSAQSPPMFSSCPVRTSPNRSFDPNRTQDMSGGSPGGGGVDLNRTYDLDRTHDLNRTYDLPPQQGIPPGSPRSSPQAITQSPQQPPRQSPQQSPRQSPRRTCQWMENCNMPCCQ